MKEIQKPCVLHLPKMTENLVHCLLNDEKDIDIEKNNDSEQSASFSDKKYYCANLLSRHLQWKIEKL